MSILPTPPSRTPVADPSVFKPGALQILVALHGRSVDPRITCSVTTRELAWMLGRKDSWVCRNRRPLTEAGLAYFPPNGYCFIYDAGFEMVHAVRAQATTPAPDTCRCGAQRIDSAVLPAGVAVYGCGVVRQHAAGAWIAMRSCQAMSEEPKAFADGSVPRVGTAVRLSDGCCRRGMDSPTPSKQMPAIGTVVAVAGATLVVDIDGAAERAARTRARCRLEPVIPADALIPVGAADPTGLTDHQLTVLRRLDEGSAIMTMGADGHISIRADRLAREGSLRVPDATLQNLIRSGLLDERLARLAASPAHPIAA